MSMPQWKQDLENAKKEAAARAESKKSGNSEDGRLMKWRFKKMVGEEASQLVLISPFPVHVNEYKFPVMENGRPMYDTFETCPEAGSKDYILEQMSGAVHPRGTFMWLAVDRRVYTAKRSGKEYPDRLSIVAVPLGVMGILEAELDDISDLHTKGEIKTEEFERGLRGFVFNVSRSHETMSATVGDTWVNRPRLAMSDDDLYKNFPEQMEHANELLADDMKRFTSLFKTHTYEELELMYPSASFIRKAYGDNNPQTDSPPRYNAPAPSDKDFAGKAASEDDGWGDSDEDDDDIAF